MMMMIFVQISATSIESSAVLSKRTKSFNSKDSSEEIFSSWHSSDLTRTSVVDIFSVVVDDVVVVVVVVVVISVVFVFEVVVVVVDLSGDQYTVSGIL